MTKTHVLITLLGSLALSSSAVADPKADPKAPKAEPKAPAGDTLDLMKLASAYSDELVSMRGYFIGTWHCEGKTTPPPGVGKTFASKGSVTWDGALDGFWLGGTSEGERVPGMPLPTIGKGENLITYDRTTKSFVNFGFNNRGGYSVATSKGFEGDKLVWTGTTSGLMKTDIRSTITKKGAAEYHLLAERMEAGKWVTGTDETCKNTWSPVKN